MNDRNRDWISADDFWDISDLIPKNHQKKVFTPKKETESPSDVCQDSDESFLGIHRYVSPNADGALSALPLQYESSVSYTPTASLIHTVTLHKKKSRYRYYHDFLEEAKRYASVEGSLCDYVPFFSYVPQYNQLSEAQLAYYFWFRTCFLRGEKIKIDYSYVLLWIYERINLGDFLDVRETQRILTELWLSYHKEFPALSAKLADWICDFSLIHQLPPPESADSELVRSVLTLKEFYLPMPNDDMERCARILLKYCSSYDYHSSKFATEENLPLFDCHVPNALVRAVAYYSSDGEILSRLSSRDCTLSRDAYAGALCTSEAGYRLEIQYCSFSRSNELRFLVGDIVKYSENKIRTYLNVKSKMTVYSISNELQKILNEYFQEQLPGKRQTVPKSKAQPYEALYDVPHKPLSLSDAARIERESWQTTEKLVSSFEESSVPEVPTVSEPLVLSEQEESAEADGETDLRTRLAPYLSVISALRQGNPRAVSEQAKAFGKMPEALADEINAIAAECYGDILLEECSDGYAVIEDYLIYIEEK